jgi:hypothetical protein
MDYYFFIAKINNLNCMIRVELKPSTYSSSESTKMTELELKLHYYINEPSSNS